MSVLKKALGVIPPQHQDRRGMAMTAFEVMLAYLARDPQKRRRGLSAKTAGKMKLPSRGPRLGRARGPGTINAYADGLQLARSGDFGQAADMLQQQYPNLAQRYRDMQMHGRGAALDVPYDANRFVP